MSEEIPNPSSRSRTAGPALCFLGEERSPRLWGLTLAERLRRQFAREGIERTIPFEEAESHPGPVILLRADAVIDQPLIPILVRRENFVLAGEQGGRSVPLAAQVAGCHAGAVAPVLRDGATPNPALNLLVRAPGDLDAAFWQSLRKRETPYALIVDEGNRPAIEWRMFMGTYKGATDLVTKHAWPLPAFHATRLLAAAGVTPNAVTAVAALLVALAFWLFLDARWWEGLAAAWLMTFLDTVDGKLARTTLTSSKWGDIFDHGIDLVHPPFWYVAWGLGAQRAGLPLSDALFWWLIGLILGGYVLQRLMEGAAIKVLGLEIHIWRPVDTLFRQVTARRNPNLILLTLSAAAGRPDWGLVAVAAWTSLCLVLHGIQLAQAFAARRRDGAIQSWMSRPHGAS